MTDPYKSGAAVRDIERGAWAALVPPEAQRNLPSLHRSPSTRQNPFMLKDLLKLALLSAALAALFLSGCEAAGRAQVASDARLQMPGMSREQVLACMGPPKKKMKEGATEVWSYIPTDDHSESDLAALKPSSAFGYYSCSHSKYFCTVNVGMKEGVMQAVNYIVPSDNWYASHEQRGCAVEKCVGSPN
jgi:hypothetical protein